MVLVGKLYVSPAIRRLWCIIKIVGNQGRHNISINKYAFVDSYDKIDFIKFWEI